MLNIANTQNYNQEAEQSLISLALKEPALTSICESTDFYISDNAIIWRAIQDIHAKNMSIDPVTVNNQVAKDSQKDLFDYLADLYAMDTPKDHADSYCKIVRDHAYSRKAIATAESIKKIASTAISSNDKSASFNTLLNDLEAHTLSDFEPISISSAFQKQATNLEDIASGEAITIKTGLHDLDLITGGLLGGDLIVLAGRPAMGKTALAMNIVENVAERSLMNEQEVCIPVFSLEMTSAQLAGRFACSMAEIDTKKMRNGDLTEQEWSRYAQAMAHVEKYDVVIDDRSAISADDILASCKRLQRKGKNIGLVVIDYIQIVKGLKDSRFESITDISGAFKALAKTLNCPVLALSQLSRDVEKRADKRPTTSDLRESGAIEQDADIIIFAYRDEVYHKDTPMPGTAELIVAKNRGGDPSVALVDFKGKYSRFSDRDDLYPQDNWEQVG